MSLVSTPWNAKCFNVSLPEITMEVIDGLMVDFSPWPENLLGRHDRRAEKRRLVRMLVYEAAAAMEERIAARVESGATDDEIYREIKGDWRMEFVPKITSRWSRDCTERRATEAAIESVLDAATKAAEKS